MLSKNIIKLCAACRPSVVVLAAVSSGRPSCCYFLPALAAATGWSPPGHRLSSDYPGPDPDTGPCHFINTIFVWESSREDHIVSLGNSTVTVTVKLRQYFQEWNGPINSGCRQNSKLAMN